jgi:rare lipoprotein A (peptidoglycan hydrolase)
VNKRQKLLFVFFLQYSLFDGEVSAKQSLVKTSQSNYHALYQSQHQARVKQSQKLPLNVGAVHYVKASFYGRGFHGKKTACGQVFNKYALTAASNTLPCGTRIRVVNPKTMDEQYLTVNDTGSFTKKYGRHLDVSQRAATDLHFREEGLANLTLTVVYLPPPKKARSKVRV